MSSASHFLTSVLLAATLGLAACVPSEGTDIVTQTGNGLAPPGAPKGSCWAKVHSAAVIETVTEEVMVTPAVFNEDGTLKTPATSQSLSTPRIVTPRQERWFEIPCPPDFTVEFVSTLQRALSARGLYKGEISGNMDNNTRKAVRAVQSANGLNSDVLSIETARELGLVVVPRTPNN